MVSVESLKNVYKIDCMKPKNWENGHNMWILGGKNGLKYMKVMSRGGIIISFYSVLQMTWAGTLPVSTVISFKRKQV